MRTIFNLYTPDGVVQHYSSIAKNTDEFLALIEGRLDGRPEDQLWLEVDTKEGPGLVRWSTVRRVVFGGHHFPNQIPGTE